ncbi:hypothetical protein NPIL_63031 [Nephila pilipes]|uniref:Uncharacterized protein n=1 Tax=Nephila pilipes TaxID=299642 RepID=A0A8X6U356_NEPPI|nr:hypothetical protein NPIL_63031 [Nephila pilipes]
MQRGMWFIHDGASEHFTLHVRNHLDVIYPKKRIGHAEPFSWPSRSPDHNPSDPSVKRDAFAISQPNKRTTERSDVSSPNLNTDLSTPDVRQDERGRLLLIAPSFLSALIRRVPLPKFIDSRHQVTSKQMTYAIEMRL